MWLFTPFGFFSVVRKSAEMVSVRSGTQGDLLRLRRTYLPELSDPAYLKGTDHPWRGQCGPNDIGRALGRIVEDIDYTNFQDEVEACNGAPRAQRYTKVWKALYGMKEDLAEPERAPWPLAGPKATYGGVIVDRRGRLLLSQVRALNDEPLWTFPKGRRTSGEAPHEAAARAVLEATGVTAQWLLHLPGVFKAGASGSHMALMLACDTDQIRHDDLDGVLPAMAWLSPDAARTRILLNTDDAERARDLAILETACSYLRPDLDAQPINTMTAMRRRPLPSRRIALPIARTFQPTQMAGLIRGCLPTQARAAFTGPQSSWCAVFEQGMLHVHDAESGVQYFRLHFDCLAEPEGDRWKIRLAELNTHPGQQTLSPMVALAALDRLINLMTAPPQGRRLTLASEGH